MRIGSTAIVAVILFSFACLSCGQATTQPSEPVLLEPSEKPVSAEARIAQLSAELDELEERVQEQAEMIRTFRLENETLAFQALYAQSLPLYEPDAEVFEEMTGKKIPVLPQNPKAAPAAGDDVIKAEFVSVVKKLEGMRLGIRFHNVSGKRIKSARGLIDFRDKDGRSEIFPILAVELKGPVDVDAVTSIERTWHGFDADLARKLAKAPQEFTLHWGTVKVEYEDKAEERKAP